MITIEEIKRDFSFIEALTGNSECYMNSETFEGHGNFCDIYFNSFNRELKQSQVDAFNEFKQNPKKYVNEIEQYISSTLSNSESSKVEEISNADLTFDVIEIPQDNIKYDLVLICGKTYKQFLFFKKNIGLRVEIKSGRINSIQRKGKWDSQKDNE